MATIVAIGVYRIYVSAACPGSPAADAGADASEAMGLGRLITTLDRVPALLYRIDRLEAADLESGSSMEAMSGAMRIAMTQSHVAIVPINTEPPAAIDLAERHLARRGFRRRIPVIGIIEIGRPEDYDPLAQEVDRVVRLEPDALACAIQELAEQAAAERRRANEALVGQPFKLVTVAAGLEAEPGQVRQIPYAAIIDAYEQHKPRGSKH